MLGVVDLLKGLALGLAIGVGGAWWAYAEGHDAARIEGEVKVLKARDEANTKLLLLTDQYHVVEQQLNAKVQGAERARTIEQEKGAALAAEFTRTRLERDGLRDQVNAFAHGPTTPSEDTLASCRQRAVALGHAVEDGLRVQEAIAGIAGTCATDLRAVLDAWPVNTTNGEEE